MNSNVAYHPQPGDEIVVTGTVQEVSADTAVIALDRGGLAAVPWDACLPPHWVLPANPGSGVLDLDV